MNLAIMQPYFFPYIGYWQLINIADKFVIYDDVTYIKQGYINRNSILSEGKAQRITLQTIGASSNNFINQIEIGKNLNKLLTTIKHSYSKAPYFNNFFPIIETLFNSSEMNLSKFLGNTLKAVSNYLEIDTQLIYSSDIEKNNALKAQDKVLEIVRILGGKHYINSIGGIDLYSKQVFAKDNVKLSFIKTKMIEYNQYKHSFLPNLSIIDVAMFNSIYDIQKMLGEFELI